MKLYIMRHGETAWNVEGRLQGQTDTELNENGVRLAKVTAEGLKISRLTLEFPVHCAAQSTRQSSSLRAEMCRLRPTTA